MTRYGTFQQPDGYWAILDRETLRVVLSDEGYQVAANIEYALNTGAKGISECDEVAEAILAVAS